MQTTRFGRALTSTTWARLLALLLASLVSTAASAKGMKALPAPDRVVLDGVPGELDGEWRDLDRPVSGDSDGAADASARVMLVFDDEALYVAADVTDDDVVAGADHLELVLGIPGGLVHSIDLFPGVPGKSRARLAARGAPVRGGKIIEAPADGGYTLEAKIPWSAIPKSATVRIGYRGAVLFHDADGGSQVQAVVGTADSSDYASLPPISMPSELALGAGLLREKSLTQAPKQNLLVDIVGDAMLERVLLYDHYLVILGPGYRGGREYYFRDLSSRDIERFEVKDFTGDRKVDILLRKRIGGSRGSLEAVEILSYHPGGDTPTVVFGHEVVLELEGEGKIVNDFKVLGQGGRTRLVVDAGSDEGLDRSRFERVSNTGATPVLVPWGSVARQYFEVQNGTFVMVKEETKDPEPIASDPPPDMPSPTPVPRPASTARVQPSSPGLDAIYELYKKKAKVKGRARFDVQGNVAEDRTPERVVVHDRDLVVFGTKFREGRGFAAVTLSQFKRTGDLEKVSLRDVTGDGKAEIIVEGILRAQLPADIEGDEAQRHVVLAYKLRNGQFDRIFGAEVQRQIGGKAVVGKYQLGRGSIRLMPGRAKGYTQQTYPWRQKEEPDASGMEPLLLPWGGVDRVDLRYDGRQFVRK